MLGITKFGDIILWDKAKKKFVVVRNYYKLPNALKASNFEVCCMSLGNGLFVSLNESNEKYTWYEAFTEAKCYKYSAPIKLYLPKIYELIDFYPLIKEFNNKINKLKSLGIACDEIKISWYWSSTEYSSSDARNLDAYDGGVNYTTKDYNGYVRAFVAF